MNPNFNLPPGVSASNPHINPPDEAFDNCFRCGVETTKKQVCRCCGNQFCDDCMAESNKNICLKCAKEGFDEECEG